MPVRPDQWAAIAETLSTGDVLEVTVEKDGRTRTLEMRLTSEYNGWWRGEGTDGRNKWNYTTYWLGDKVLAGDRKVILRTRKSNGARGSILGTVLDVRLAESSGGSPDSAFDFTGGGL